MNNSQLINQDSGNYEWYTPLKIVFAAKQVMGSIDLDPFASKESAERMNVINYITVEEDGLTMKWFGNVWMNHPFSRENNHACVAKLVAEYCSLRVKQACCITFAATSERWFKPLLDYPQCYLSPRTNYYLPDGTIKKRRNQRIGSHLLR